jgi:hypothetical protein
LVVTEGKEKPSVIYTEGFVYAAEFPRKRLMKLFGNS